MIVACIFVITVLVLDVFIIVVSIIQVSLHGGQVLSWKTDNGEELLFTSTKVISSSSYSTSQNAETRAFEYATLCRSILTLLPIKSQSCTDRQRTVVKHERA